MNIELTKDQAKEIASYIYVSLEEYINNNVETFYDYLKSKYPDKNFATCKHCKKTFELLHARAKYCEDCIPLKNALNQKAYRERKKGGYE